MLRPRRLTFLLDWLEALGRASGVALVRLHVFSWMGFVRRGGGYLTPTFPSYRHFGLTRRMTRSSAGAALRPQRTWYACLILAGRALSLATAILPVHALCHAGLLFPAPPFPVLVSSAYMLWRTAYNPACCCCTVLPFSHLPLTCCIPVCFIFAGGSLSLDLHVFSQGRPVAFTGSSSDTYMKGHDDVARAVWSVAFPPRPSLPPPPPGLMALNLLPASSTVPKVLSQSLHPPFARRLPLCSHPCRFLLPHPVVALAKTQRSERGCLRAAVGCLPCVQRRVRT